MYKEKVHLVHLFISHEVAPVTFEKPKTKKKCMNPKFIHFFSSFWLLKGHWCNFMTNEYMYKMHLFLVHVLISSMVEVHAGVLFIWVYITHIFGGLPGSYVNPLNNWSGAI
jgi:hypothetical protein